MEFVEVRVSKTENTNGLSVVVMCETEADCGVDRVLTRDNNYSGR